MFGNRRDSKEEKESKAAENKNDPADAKEHEYNAVSLQLARDINTLFNDTFHLILADTCILLY